MCCHLCNSLMEDYQCCHLCNSLMEDFQSDLYENSDLARSNNNILVRMSEMEYPLFTDNSFMTSLYEDLEIRSGYPTFSPKTSVCLQSHSYPCGACTYRPSLYLQFPDCFGLIHSQEYRLFFLTQV